MRNNVDPYSEPLKQSNGGWSTHEQKRQSVQNDRKALVDHNQKILDRRLNKPTK